MTANSTRHELSSGTYDAVVIGAGVIGLAVAWAAARRGLRTCVIERSRPGAGASGVAAGMLAPVGEASFGEGDLLALNLASHALWPGFADSLEESSGRETGYLPLGALHVALDGDEESELRRSGDLHERLGLESHWLGPDECRELESRLAPDLVGGLFVPEDAAADPRQLIAALEAAVIESGADIVLGRTPVVSRFDGMDVSLELDDGRRVEASRLVLATGAWSAGQEADWLPEELRAIVRPVKGQILELRAQPPASDQVAERIVCGERFYAVPRADGTLALGATVEEKGFDSQITAGAVHELLREGYRALPDIGELQFVGANSGLRPTTPDNAPLIGASSLEPKLIYATGHFRNGILLAPATGDLIASLLAGETPSHDLEPFRPERFSDSGRFAERTPA